MTEKNIAFYITADVRPSSGSGADQRVGSQISAPSREEAIQRAESKYGDRLVRIVDVIQPGG